MIHRITPLRLRIAALSTIFLVQMFGVSSIAFHLGVFLTRLLPVELAWMIVGVVISLLLALCTWNYIRKLREVMTTYTPTTSTRK